MPVFRKLSTLAKLQFLSFLGFILRMIVIFVCLILAFSIKLLVRTLNTFLLQNVWMIVIYDQGNIHCCIYMSFLSCWLFTKNSIDLIQTRRKAEEELCER